ncbi:MAG: segregation/condensation protein A [Anaerolineaceae bacterium]|nr:segregation/condensation protein A [Anaerolineaceae bacterium]MBN2678348.1 segregation/condensation protein A [Anaerolineaceae bacterium]
MSLMVFKALDPDIQVYQVATDIYQGPLDLLLTLIERAELDITKLALAQVTDQYLGYLRTTPSMNPEEVSSFLVIAAKLIQIKSEALLPRPPEREPGEEDPGVALVEQLKTYKQFKTLSLWFGAREEAGLQTYLRTAPPPKVEGKLDLSGLTLDDLVAAARSLFAEGKDLPLLNTIIAIPRVTIREKINRILITLRRQGHMTFREMLGQHATRVEVLVTFLAVLELVKRYMVSVKQDKLFDNFLVQPLESSTLEEEIDSEF